MEVSNKAWELGRAPVGFGCYLWYNLDHIQFERGSDWSVFFTIHLFYLFIYLSIIYFIYYKEDFAMK